MKSFYVEGFRSFRNRVTVEDLGRVVAFYGLNNSGKSNLLAAMELLSGLLSLPLSDGFEIGINELLARPELSRTLLQHAGLFCQIPEPHNSIYLGATWEDGVEVQLEIGTPMEGRINVRICRWIVDGRDLGSQFLDAWSSFVQHDEEYDPDLEDEESLIETIEQFRRDWVECWKTHLVAAIQTSVPIDLGAKRQLASRLRSREPGVRRSAEKFLREFEQLPLNLPSGRLVLYDEDEGIPEFGWECGEAQIPLGWLGTGAQILFRVLAGVSTSEAQTLLLDEPEANLNASIQDRVIERLLNLAEKLNLQLMLATHSLNFARSEMDLRIVERSNDTTTVRPLRTEDRPRMDGNRAAQGRQTPDEDALVGYDFSIRLPRWVQSDLKVQPNDTLYFVKHPKGYALMSLEQLEAEIDQPPERGD